MSKLQFMLLLPGKGFYGATSSQPTTNPTLRLSSPPQTHTHTHIPTHTTTTIWSLLWLHPIKQHYTELHTQVDTKSTHDKIFLCSHCQPIQMFVQQLCNLLWWWTNQKAGPNLATVSLWRRKRPHYTVFFAKIWDFTFLQPWVTDFSQYFRKIFSV